MKPLIFFAPRVAFLTLLLAAPVLNAQVAGLPAAAISDTGATLNGSFIGATNNTVFSFLWGTTTASGNIQAAQTVSNASGSNVFHAAISGLQPGTVYHFQAIASNTINSSSSSSAVLTFATTEFSLFSSGLQLWLPLTNGSGFTATDASGNGSVGLLVGFPSPPSWGNVAWDVTGSNVATLFFNTNTANSNEYVLVPDTPNINFNSSGAFTLAAWVRPSVAGASEPANNGILAKGFGAGGEEYSIDLLGGKFRFYYHDGAGAVHIATSTFTPAANTWAHIVGTVDLKTNNVMKVFVNGAFNTQVTGLPSTILATNHPLSIGDREGTTNSGYNYPFEGAISDVRLYNRTLGTNEVAALYLMTGGIPLISSATIQPPLPNLTRFVGDNVSLSITNIFPSLQYQWQINGSNITGATVSPYTIANAQLTNSGNYTVVLSSPLFPVGISAVTSAPVSVTIQALPGPDTNSNLIAKWKFDEVSGTTAADSSGNAHNAVLNGISSPDWITGIIGGALQFNVNPTDAGHEVVLCPGLNTSDNHVFDFSSGLQFTLSAWVQGESTANQTSGAGIVAKGNGAGGEQYCLGVTNNSTFQFYVRDASGNLATLNAASPVSTLWRHVVAVYDGKNGFMAIYINGQLSSSAVAPISLAASTHEVSIGNRESTAANTYNLPFTGNIDEVRIYGRAMNSGDVQALYLSTGTFPPSVVTQPVPLTNHYVGDTQVYTVLADGTAPLAYQWQFNGTNLVNLSNGTNGASVANATTASLTLTNLQLTNAGSYTVVIANNYNSITSAPAMLTMQAAPTLPLITQQPLSLTESPGYNSTFKVLALGAAPLLYQWQFNGTNVNGATNSSLTITNVQATNVGNYLVLITNSAGGATSSPPAMLTLDVPLAVSTLAGLINTTGTNDGLGVNARFNKCGGIAIDNSGTMYIADNGNEVIRKMTSDGVVTTWVGSPGVSGTNDGMGANARFNAPDRVALDAATNVYVVDTGGETIRKITPAGLVSTLAGKGNTGGTNNGAGAAARFFDPEGIAVDAATNVYVAEYGAQDIRKITPQGVVSIFAGLSGVSGSADGVGTAARFLNPNGLVFDSSSNLYVCEDGNSIVRKITPDGAVTTIAGLAGSTGGTDGVGTNARFNNLDWLTLDTNGNLYVAEYGGHTIRKITPGGNVSTVAGLSGSLGNVDGVGNVVRFNTPNGLAFDSSGNLLIPDSTTQTVRKGVQDDGRPIIQVQPHDLSAVLTYNPVFSVTALGAPTLDYQWFLNGNPVGPGTNSSLAVNPSLSTTGDSYFVVVSNAVGAVTSSPPAMLTIGAPLSVFTLAGNPGTIGSSNGLGTNAGFYFPSGLALDAAGNLYVADSFNHAIRQITPAGVVGTIAGLAGSPGTNNGVGAAARFNDPNSIAIDSTGRLFVADSVNDAIRLLTPTGSNWNVTTIAGSPTIPGTNDGSGAIALFSDPKGIGVDHNGIVYVADSDNNTIRKISPNGTNWTVATFAGAPTVVGSVDGTGNAARFNSPRYIATDLSNNVYVADWDNDTVREITPAGKVTTLAGVAGSTGSTDGTGSVARFNSVRGLSVDPAGNVYLADFSNSTLRKITPSGAVSTLAGVVGTLGTNDGVGSSALFNEPCAVLVDPTGTVFYIVDTSNHTVRKAVYDFGQPIITSQPQDQMAPLGTNVTFTVTATSSNPGALNYQWQLFNQNVTGATNPVLSLTNIQAAQAGSYQVLVSNAIAVAASLPASLIITDQPVAFLTGIGDTQYAADGLHLQVGYLTGQGSVVISASSDLSSWTPIYTNPSGFGSFTFIDPAATNLDHRFYRAVVVP